MVILGLSHQYMFHLCRAENVISLVTGLQIKRFYMQGTGTCGASFIPGLGIDKGLDLELMLYWNVN